MSNKLQGKFNLIAPLYGLAFNYQVNYFARILAEAKDEFDFSEYKTILDVGCGTGALCQVLARQGLQVTGIDAAAKMINIASGNLANEPVALHIADALSRMPFDNKSFDLVISSYVLHGMPEVHRKILYKEMSRIAKHRVIIHDYNENRSLLTDFIEWVEGGHYFDFIKNATPEMQDNFANMQIIRISMRAAWYICTPY